MTSSTTDPDPEEVRHHVRMRYASFARGGTCCGDGCCNSGSSAGVTLPTASPEQLSTRGEGPQSEVFDGPSGSDLGLGCGTPIPLLDLKPGEVVLDLGSGAGGDCFRASILVGSRGRVIGVDMTPEMVARSRASARKGSFANVEFRLGEVEHLPLADESVDAVASNCVVNLVPDKGMVYREVFRVLRKGGRLAIADVLSTRPIPGDAKSDLAMWASCSSGAIPAAEVARLLEDAGFIHVAVELSGSESCCDSLTPQAKIGVVPAMVTAFKPESRERTSSTGPG